MKVYTANITVSGPRHCEQYGRKNTSNSFTRVQRKFPHTKYSSRQLIYTKATRIFLQHQILILYTALFGKGQWLLLVSLGRIISSLLHRELDKVFYKTGLECMHTLVGNCNDCSIAM